MSDESCEYCCSRCGSRYPKSGRCVNCNLELQKICPKCKQADGDCTCSK
ncbi:MAG: hypothetical protein ACE5DI_05565 [Candidatus Micrarchaeia archaeon]